MLVRDILPEMIAELESGLKEYERPELAGTVANLVMVDRCRCGDYFCGTFYTAPKPSGAWGIGHETIPLDCDNGYLNIDVLNGDIVSIEVLYRNEIRDKLIAALP